MGAVKLAEAERLDTLPDFYEVAPNVWVPRGYRPTRWEQATPIVRDNTAAAREYVRCVDSLPHFLFSYCWTLHTDDPAGPTFRKFPKYPYLVRAAERAQVPQNTHVEKSRQMLMSWFWMAVMLWDILFHDTWADLAISRLEKLVDDGAEKATTDSLFGKLLVIWKGLPPFLRHELEFRALLVRCPATNSYIKGQSGDSASGRGPTYKRGLWDEAAFSRNSHALFTALSQSVKSGLVQLSTPMGKANEFARVRFDKRVNFQKLSFHWTEHPELAVGLYCECGWQADDASRTPNHVQYAQHTCLKNTDPREQPRRHPRSPIYDRLTINLTPDQVASEFDLSYEQSQRGRVYEAFDSTKPQHIWDHEAIIGPIGPREDDLSYRRRHLRAALQQDKAVVCGWDFGVGAPTSLVLGQVEDEKRMRVRWLDTFEESDEGWRYFHAFVQGLWAPIVKEVTGLDIVHYGDPYGKGRDSDLKSWIQNLRSASPPIIVIHEPRVGTVLEWLDFIADLIRRDQFSVSTYAVRLLDMLGQYHFPLDKNGVPIPGRHLPEESEWNHVADAKRYVYMFRWHARLYRVDQVNSGAGKLLRAGRGDRTRSGRKEF